MADLNTLGSNQKLDGVFMTSLKYVNQKRCDKAVILDRDGTLTPMNTRSDGTKGAPGDIKDFHITTEAI